MTLWHRETSVREVWTYEESERTTSTNREEKEEEGNRSSVKMLYSRLFPSSSSHKRAQPFFFFLRARANMSRCDFTKIKTAKAENSKKKRQLHDWNLPSSIGDFFARWLNQSTKHKNSSHLSMFFFQSDWKLTARSKTPEFSDARQRFLIEASYNELYIRLRCQYLLRIATAFRCIRGRWSDKLDGTRHSILTQEHWPTIAECLLSKTGVKTRDENKRRPSSDHWPVRVCTTFRTRTCELCISFIDEAKLSFWSLIRSKEYTYWKTMQTKASRTNKRLRSSAVWENKERITLD